MLIFSSILGSHLTEPFPSTTDERKQHTTTLRSNHPSITRSKIHSTSWIFIKTSITHCQSYYQTLSLHIFNFFLRIPNQISKYRTNHKERKKLTKCQKNRKVWIQREVVLWSSKKRHGQKKKEKREDWSGVNCSQLRITWRIRARYGSLRFRSSVPRCSTRKMGWERDTWPAARDPPVCARSTNGTKS